MSKSLWIPWKAPVGGSSHGDEFVDAHEDDDHEDGENDVRDGDVSDEEVGLVDLEGEGLGVGRYVAGGVQVQRSR